MSGSKNNYQINQRQQEQMLNRIDPIKGLLNIGNTNQ